MGRRDVIMIMAVAVVEAITAMAVIVDSSGISSRAGAEQQQQ